MRSLDILAVLRVAVLAIVGGVAGVAMAEEPAAAVSVKVRDVVLHGIDARLFGQFMERPSWGGEIGPEGSLIPGTRELRPEAKRLIREMQIPIVRFPGGTDVDYIDWLDMIDNVPGRSAERPITTGHTGNQVGNNFGYDEFLRLCGELAMEPIVVVNFREGLLSRQGPQAGALHAAKLVAYCNAAADAELPGELAAWPRLRARNGHPAPYGVKYIQIGNESWAFTRDVSQDQYLAALKAYVEAIRAVDPAVRLIVDGQPAELAARIHRELGDRIAYFAVHHYQPWQIAEVRRGSEQVAVADLTAKDIWYAWVTLPGIDAAGQSILANGDLEQARRLGYPVAMTEWNWNGWWGPSLRRPRGLGLAVCQGGRGRGHSPRDHASGRHGPDRRPIDAHRRRLGHPRHLLRPPRPGRSLHGPQRPGHDALRPASRQPAASTRPGERAALRATVSDGVESARPIPRPTSTSWPLATSGNSTCTASTAISTRRWTLPSTSRRFRRRPRMPARSTSSKAA